MSGHQWTMGDLALVHDELLKVADNAVIAAGQWQGVPLVVPSGAATVLPAMTPASVAGVTNFPLDRLLNEMVSSSKAAVSELRWTIAGPAILIGLGLVGKPLGYSVNSGVVGLVGVAFIIYCASALWETLTRLRLSGSRQYHVGMAPYTKVDARRSKLLLKLATLAAGCYVSSAICLRIVGVLFESIVPLMLVAMISILATAGSLLFYSAALVANDGRSLLQALQLLRPKRIFTGTPLKIATGMVIAVVPFAIGLGVITVSVVAAPGFSNFNPAACIGMAILLFSFVPLVAYLTETYKHVR